MAGGSIPRTSLLAFHELHIREAHRVDCVGVIEGAQAESGVLPRRAPVVLRAGLCGQNPECSSANNVKNRQQPVIYWSQARPDGAVAGRYTMKWVAPTSFVVGSGVSAEFCFKSSG